MLKRKALTALKAWKERIGKKPLIVQGARQVGKTYAIRAFAKENYDVCYELNFLQNTALKDIFLGDLSADAVLSGIRLSFPELRLHIGHTLIFLDELQACPEAATALKFLGADPRFDVIASGSALGMLHGQVSSWPVGQVEYLDMYALDFEEFLWAMGVEPDLIASLAGYMDGHAAIPQGIHQAMTSYLRQYMVIGGMPDVVNAFRAEQDFAAADAVQRRIYRDYEADIAHYAEPDIRLKAQRCWQSIPLQLSKPNHKFQYEIVEHRSSARKFGTAVDWLTAAGMACAVYHVSSVEYPLKAFAEDTSFRLYPNDIGLLICTYDFSLKRALAMPDMSMDTEESIVIRTAKGGIYEALAADFLQKQGRHDLYFYRNTAGTAEIEFLIENRDGVIPIELKAGHNKTRSLDEILQSEAVPYGYKFAEQNAGRAGKRIMLPHYMLMFL